MEEGRERIKKKWWEGKNEDNKTVRKRIKTTKHEER